MDSIQEGPFQRGRLEVQTKMLMSKRSKLESEIKKSIQEAIDTLHQKEIQLIKKVKEQTEQLESMMKTKQMDLQMYLQQSRSIQKALELEDEVQLFEMYLSSGSRTGGAVTPTQRKEKADVADVWFVYDFDLIKEQIAIMDVMNSKVDLAIRQVDNIDLTATPAFEEDIDGRHYAGFSKINDCLVVDLADTKAIVFSEGQLLKSFYKREGKSYLNTIKMPGNSVCITLISIGEVLVSFYNTPRIIRVAVTPDLELVSTLMTSKIYSNVAALNKSTLVVGSHQENCVDLITINGTILKTFTTHPRTGKKLDPLYIHVTRQGSILVTDNVQVSCITPAGDVIFTSEVELITSPQGIISTEKGDILVCSKDTVILLGEEGEYIRDILTKEDGLDRPNCLCVGGDRLYLSNSYRGISVYQFIPE